MKSSLLKIACYSFKGSFDDAIITQPSLSQSTQHLFGDTILIKALNATEPQPLQLNLNQRMKIINDNQTTVACDGNPVDLPPITSAGWTTLNLPLKNPFTNNISQLLIGDVRQLSIPDPIRTQYFLLSIHSADSKAIDGVQFSTFDFM